MEPKKVCPAALLFPILRIHSRSRLGATTLAPFGFQIC
jgi:hypothetical protein